MGRQRRLTRAELTVVTGSVLLALLAIGAAGESARRLAQELTCLSNIEVLAGAWLGYSDDNDGRLVGGHTSDTPLQWVGQPAFDGTLDDKLDAIRRGLLFPYVGDLNAYHCPADQGLNDPDQLSFRTYSIAGGANGEFWPEFERAEVYSDLENPATRYIFVEEADPRGNNMGSWQMSLARHAWIDPLAMWHEEATTLGFADGHGEVHRWHDDSLIEWCHRAMARQGFTFNMTPPADEPDDVAYMAAGFPYKALR